MKRVFRRLPIRLKLIAMIMTTVAIVLILAFLGFLLVDVYQTKQNLQEDLESQAGLILQNTDAALQFGDKSTASATLQTLKSVSSIRLACLYDARGRLFIHYRHASETQDCPAAADPDRQQLGLRRLEVSQTGYLQDDGTKFGSVRLSSDLSALFARLRVQGGVAVVLLLLAGGVAMFLSSNLQAIVSGPVTALSRTASDVSSRGDYSLRATRTTDDELGVLVDAFNRMLERIQEREAELSKANEELRREVVERRRAEQERAELLVREREANRLKDEFLATLSHELRTPLNAILGWTKLLRANAVPADGVDRALEKVERNAQVQARLVEDLLEISRIVSGKLRLDPRPIDLAVLCSTAIDSIRPAAEARGVAIHREFPQPVLKTVGDPDRLQQVIWNLLSNAVKFTPAGGSVTVALRRDGNVDEISVTDTGIGIEPSFLPNVFETFRQADASSTRVYGGLGLGLAIVKQLVELHGGEVRASSAGADAGATFTVRLPVRSEARWRAVEGHASPAQPIDRRLTGRTVLVVDDDEDTTELLVSTMERAGADVRAASSAEEALAICADWLPEVLVSDIAMPREDGYRLVEQVVAAMGSAAPRVRIALSAFAGPDDRERALGAGFHQHVSKPVDPAALVALLEDMLGSHADHRYSS
jgi:signal transduction histidine kinase/ActR/RegA family two-component response regulator